MSVFEAVQVNFRKYAVFSGRARPSEFWWWVLFNFVVTFALGLVDQNLGYLTVLALFLPSFAVSVRRLHDTGKSGWFILIGLIPLVGPIILIVWYASAGQREPNKYGEPPA